MPASRTGGLFDLFPVTPLAHPQLQWAGMAAMIGPSFAAGFQDLALMRDIADAANGPVEDLPGALQGLLPPPLQILNVLSQLSEEDIEFYETTFLEMQKEIFRDQASMHEAYLGGARRGSGVGRRSTPDTSGAVTSAQVQRTLGYLTVYGAARYDPEGGTATVSWGFSWS